jgi:hypothetical protein
MQEIPTPDAWGWNRTEIMGWQPVWTKLPEACAELVQLQEGLLRQMIVAVKRLIFHVRHSVLANVHNVANKNRIFFIKENIIFDFIHNIFFTLVLYFSSLKQKKYGKILKTVKCVTRLPLNGCSPQKYY